MNNKKTIIEENLCNFEIDNINSQRILDYLINPIPEKALINQIKNPKIKLKFKWLF